MGAADLDVGDLADEFMDTATGDGLEPLLALVGYELIPLMR
jgi:hypothetical protein